MDYKSGWSYCRNESRDHPLSDLTLPQLFQQAAERNDENGTVTWYHDSTTFTHKQLYEKAFSFAKGLLALGLKKGDVICSLGCKGHEASVLFIASSCLGLRFISPYLYAPVNKTLSELIDTMEMSTILVGSAVSGLFDESLYDVCSEIIRERTTPGNTKSFHVPKAFFHDSEVKQSFEGKGISVNNNEANNQIRNSQHINELARLGADVSDERVLSIMSSLQTNEPCLYVTTSGSTGTPKRILLGAAVFTNAHSRYVERLDRRKESRLAGLNICSIDLAHVEMLSASFGLGFKLLIYPIQSHVLEEETYIKELLSANQNFRPEIAHMDQHCLNYIVNHPDIDDDLEATTPKGVLLTAYGSSSAYREKVTSKFPLSLDWYGSTEFFCGTSCKPGDLRRKPQSVGKPFLNIEVKVADELGQPVPINTRGEVYLRGYCCFLEYHNQPELTSDAINSDGWFRTRDCGIMDTDGELSIVGRMTPGDFIKLFDDIVYVAPIESVLKEHPSIKECCVLGRTIDDGLACEVIYCIVLKPETSLTMENVKLFCQNNMQQQQWPWRIVFRDELPRTGGNRKIHRKKLLEDVDKIIRADHMTGVVDWIEALNEYSLWNKSENE